MKKCIVVMILFVVLPAVAWAQAPSNEELYQMMKNLERKLDAAIDETNRAKAEADKAREEAARAKEELERIKAVSAETPAAVPAESLVRDLETKPGLGASFEVVYLQPSQSNLDFVIKDSNTDNYPEGSFHNVEPGYDWGGRFGLSYDFGSGTDIGAQFTRITTQDSASAVAPPGGALWGTWLHPNSLIDDNDVTSAEARYDFEHYVVDLGAGRWLDIGKDFNLRIEAGLRYADTSQEFDITYWDNTVPERVDISNDNEFSGWGPRVGLGLDWRVGRGFNIFSSVAGSVLVGDFDLSLREVDNGTIYANLKDTVDNRTVPVIEMRTGIGYTYQLKNGRSMGAKAGYEWQNWYNMVTARRFSDDVDAQLMSTDTTDIGLDGFFFECFINF